MGASNNAAALRGVFMLGVLGESKKNTLYVYNVIIFTTDSLVYWNKLFKLPNIDYM